VVLPFASGNLTAGCSRSQFPITKKLNPAWSGVAFGRAETLVLHLHLDGSSDSAVSSCCPGLRSENRSSQEAPMSARFTRKDRSTSVILA
jgi:hypothetical protein